MFCVRPSVRAGAELDRARWESHSNYINYPITTNAVRTAMRGAIGFYLRPPALHRDARRKRAS
eukprot:5774879-Lingulodinium_polyedra.AAC.1